MSISVLPFGWLVWFAALAFVLHVAEEWLGGFTEWVQGQVNPHYTQTHYRRIHVAGMVVGLLGAGVLTIYPNTVLLVIYFATIATPWFVWNSMFHVGATVRWRRYCPGVVTAVVVYMPFSIVLVASVIREHLVPGRWLVLAAGIGLVIHALEVRKNVFRYGSKSQDNTSPIKAPRY